MKDVKRAVNGERKKRFLFITPPYERLKGLTVESVPLGILYLATVLDRAGYDAKVFDADSLFNNGELSYSNVNRIKSQSNYVRNLTNDNHPAWQEIRGLLTEFKPDFVGVSMMTPIFSSCKKVIEIVSETLPDAVILAGGPHVTILKENGLKCMPEVDVAFVGEAEESIVEFTQRRVSGKNWTSVKGLVYRKGDKVFFTGYRNRIHDLDALPIPKRSLLVNEFRYQRAKLGLMIASRGCPFQCAFCASVPLWKREMRRRSPQNLVKEIDYLVRNYNITSFGFWDDTFTIDKKAVIGFCRLIYKKYGSRRFKWNCLTNINCVDDDVLFWLKKAGCKTISIGIESGSDRILKLVKKNITTDQVRNVARLIKKRGFWLHTFFMVGFPYETEKDIRKTINFIKEIRPDSMNLCTFTPHPGTELYDYVVSKGMFDMGNNFSVYNNISQHSLNNFFVENMSHEKYRELLDKLIKLSEYISEGRNFRKMWLIMNRLTWEKVKHRLKRYL